MKKFSIVAAVFMSLSLYCPVYAQRISQVHELFPFIGLYAPDRFQSSVTFGARYEYHIDPRFSFGATVVSQKQGRVFFRKSAGRRRNKAALRFCTTAAGSHRRFRWERSSLTVRWVSASSDSTRIQISLSASESVQKFHLAKQRLSAGK